ncbi:MAG: AAA family ATPase, partial [Candidatus Shapirobacteria bacterium]
MKNLIDLIKKIKGFSLKKDKKTDKKEEKNTIPKDILNKLPPGVKITKIEIGPKQIVKLIIWLILGYWVLSTLKQALVPESISNVSISEVITAVKKDEVAKIIVADNQILANLKDSDKILVASKETAISMTEILQKEGVDLSKFNLQIENRQGWKMIGEILSVVLTIGLPVLLILWLFKKQSGGAGGGMFGFGKSTAKLFIKGKQSLTFKDVAGVEEAKNDLVEVVDFLKHPEKYHKMGARATKGVLLVGPSGVGKTLLAKAVAGEAEVPF